MLRSDCKKQMQLKAREVQVLLWSHPPAWLGSLGFPLHLTVSAAETKFRRQHWWRCDNHDSSAYSVFLSFYLHFTTSSFLSFSCFLLSGFSLMFFFFLPIFPALPVCTGWSSRSPAVEEEAALPCGAEELI